MVLVVVVVVVEEEEEEEEEEVLVSLVVVGLMLDSMEGSVKVAMFASSAVIMAAIKKKLMQKEVNRDVCGIVVTGLAQSQKTEIL